MAEQWEVDLFEQYKKGIFGSYAEYSKAYKEQKKIQNALKKGKPIPKDPGQIGTDQILAEIEAKTHAAYKQAAKELEAKAEKQWDKLFKKYNEVEQQLNKGEITKAEFDAWFSRQSAMAQQMTDLAEVLAKDLHKTNQIAAKIATDSMADVYALNANYAMYDIFDKGGLHPVSYDWYVNDVLKGKPANMGASFLLYNHDTAELLLKTEWSVAPEKGKNSLLPAPSKKKLKELKALKATNPDQLWDQKHLESAILQGVLQGEPSWKIAKRLSGVATMDERQAIRNARTMTTNVQNMGRQRSYLNAKDMGIDLVIEWCANLDGVTRDSHRHMHGERRSNTKTGKFSNGCRWPGDPQGPAAEVYNCRCTTLSWVKGFEHDKVTDNPYLQDKQMTFEEWQNAMKKASSAVPIPTPAPAPATKSKKTTAAQAQPVSPSPPGLTNPTGSAMVDNSFSEERRANAKRFYSGEEADNFYRPLLDDQWENLTEYEQYSVWQYTHNSNPINKSLSGYHESWSRSNYIGPANTEWGHEDRYRSFDTSAFSRKFGKSDGHVDYHKTVTNLTNAIQKSTLSEDALFVRGGGYGGLAGMLENGGLPFDEVSRILRNGSKAERDALVARVKGQTFQEHSFLSTGVAKGTGFGGQVKYSIYAPKGTHAIYCEPTSYYGRTVGGDEKLYKKGMRKNGVGGEAEMLFQRGSSYYIRDIEIHSNGEVRVKLEVREQPNYFRYGDEDTYNNGKTRHKK